MHAIVNSYLTETNEKWLILPLQWQPLAVTCHCTRLHTLYPNSQYHFAITSRLTPLSKLTLFLHAPAIPTRKHLFCWKVFEDLTLITSSNKKYIFNQEHLKDHSDSHLMKEGYVKKYHFWKWWLIYMHFIFQLFSALLQNNYFCWPIKFYRFPIIHNQEDK